MFQKLFKPRLQSYGLLTAGLAVVIGLTAGAGIWHHQKEVAKQPLRTSSAIVSAPQKGVAAPSSSESTESADIGQSISPNKQVSPSTKSTATNSGQPSGQATNNNSSNTSAVSANPATVTVALSINGNSKGNVVLASANNHCEVLNQALKIGLLSSLDMRYDAQYKTYAIYVINGIGDSNAVWWMYTVNGKSPPYGCSNLPVRAGDSVNWQYIKG